MNTSKEWYFDMHHFDRENAPFTQACLPFLGLCRLPAPVAAPPDSRLPGPRVDAGDLEAEVPGARVLSLPLGPGAHAVAVCLAVLPPAAVRPAVVEVEPPARHVQLGPGHACCLIVGM